VVVHFGKPAEQCEQRAPAVGAKRKRPVDERRGGVRGTEEHTPNDRHLEVYVSNAVMRRNVIPSSSQPSILASSSQEG